MATEDLEIKEEELKVEEIPVESVDAAAQEQAQPEAEPAAEEPVAESPAEEQVQSEEPQAPEDIPEDDLEGVEEAKATLSGAEYDAWLAMQRKIHFANRHKFGRASNQQRHEMYNSGPHIVESNEGDIEKVKTRSAKIREDKIELIASAQSGKVLEGVVAGYRPVETNDASSRRLLADVEFGNGMFRVLIPDYVFVNFHYEENIPQNLQAQIEERMRKMVGSPVHFIVKHVDEKNLTAYADRLKAMEKEIWSNYIRETRTGRPRINPGDTITAQVIAVGNGFIIVNAGGADSRIGRDELAYDAASVSDYRQVYKRGEAVVCRVKSVNIREVTKFQGEKYSLAQVKLSVKDCYKNPVEEYWDDFSEGGIYLAKVTNVNEVGVFVSLKNKATCLCAFPSYGRTPYIGEERPVRVTRKEILESGERRISGVIISQ